jgi:protein tyrosine phosphatase (PTP) superfamily phosphohydrolase (DUF442 family)
MAQRRHLLSVVLSGSAIVAGCTRTSTAPPAENSNSATAVQKVDENRPVAQKLSAEHLPNVYRLTENVISGGLPEGDDAFQELADLGVKTVISVDGMTPDVETARRHGLRYVHLPHSYDGIPETRAKELAKAFRDLPGPIYVHCHHGKHRSPAAATVACVGAGLIEPLIAESILRTVGTSEKYRGLYESARTARKLDQALLDELQVEFREKSPIPPMADAMVALEHTHDHLKQIADVGWKSPPKHPDLDPAHEALLLREHYTEMLRMEQVAREPEAFRKILSDSEVAAKRLLDALNATPVSSESAKSALDSVTQSCAACHAAYRDTPLSEKEPSQ